MRMISRKTNAGGGAVIEAPNNVAQPQPMPHMAFHQGPEAMTVGELIGEFMHRAKMFVIKLVALVVVICLAACFLLEKVTGIPVSLTSFPSFSSLHEVKEKTSDEVATGPELIKVKADTKPSSSEANEALAIVQAQTGEKLSVPKPRPLLTEEELISLIGDTTEEECRKNGKCASPLVLKGIGKKESSLNPNAIVLEKKLVGVKFRTLPGEGALSEALSPFSFGLMQINWGYSKEICGDMLVEEGGDPESLYLMLLNPRINIRCAILVFLEKWAMAKKFNGPNRLVESIRLYNGKNAPASYPQDVMGHMVSVLAKEVRG